MVGFKILRIAFSAITIILAVYTLLTKDNQVMPFMLFFLGAALVMTSISEIRRKRKVSGVFCITASAFLLFTAIITYLPLWTD